jgi:hypothetical protein
VFANFCEQIGVANIRQYEERELRYSIPWLLYLLSFKTYMYGRIISWSFNAKFLPTHLM